MYRLRKIPMIFSVQDLWPESLETVGVVRSIFVLNILSKMVEWIYHRCDKVLVQSEAFIQPVIQAGAIPERTSYFTYWVEDDKASANAIVKLYKRTDDQRQINGNVALGYYKHSYYGINNE